ncbi:adenosylcobinamide-GDP ribazoletransferase [Mesobaculum littorinae]|uniref:Adenosylcobinamide-GDP ribazoletransferase n=1 Tax=Mesobaculum littorinae TaxID=2486419 RepID=A0A438AMG3_9RHOB|nr:adenosylcobinamide-GDP ribazoletransferase [Mesobaculum littorinae]RVV99805.1 adenosylcobinamide-GDP ribazoletransferase [Mesobaculum littorinae]
MSDPLRPRTADLAEALALLTRLPAPHIVTPRGARAAWAWPVAGGVVGLFAAIPATLGMSVGPAFAAGMALAVGTTITGGLHEDGLADTADGLWGGHDKARRLEIMRDSRIGSYGVLALILSIGLRWAALATLCVAGGAGAALVAAAMLSRAAMGALAAALQHARADGLSVATGRPDRPTAALGAGIAVVMTLILCGWAAILLVLVVAAVTWACGAIARSKIGGQTGDILGATQQMTELAVLATLAAMV